MSKIVDFILYLFYIDKICIFIDDRKEHKLLWHEGSRFAQCKDCDSIVVIKGLTIDEYKSCKGQMLSDSKL